MSMTVQEALVAAQVAAGKQTIDTTSQSLGFILLPLQNMRVVASNDVPVKGAADGGVLSKDTAPLLERVNAATDKALRVKWAASSSVEIILGQVVYPPDLDDTADVTVNLLVKAGGATDTPTLTVSAFEGVGDTDAGGATAAISATLAQKTVAIAAADIGAYPKTLTLGLTPGTHTTDTVELYGAWITYTRK